MPDNDPLESLDNFPEGLHVDSLPASEVRRRGDRMRRRNTALATVGGVVAAAVFIGTPVALLSGNDGGNDVDPAPAPTETEDARPQWLTEIPAEFPLADGFPKTNGLDGSPTEVVDDPTPFTVLLCGAEWPTFGHVDSAGISYAGESEDTSDRMLLLLSDESAARASLDELREGVRACPNAPWSDGDSILLSSLVDLDLGTEDSVVVAQRLQLDDGLITDLSVTEVARSGNALFVERSYGSAADDATVTFETERLKERSAVPLGAMCVFSADPCSTSDVTPDPENSPPSPVESEVAGIPAAFPLTAGFPEDDVETNTIGPNATVDTAPHIDLCGTPAWAPDGVVERLAVLRTGPEFRDARELVTFPSVDVAIAAVAAVEAAVAACPETPGGEGTGGYANKVLRGNTGYESFTWGSVAQTALDGGVFQITRVGYSVLVLYAAGEMSEPSLQPAANELVNVTKTLAPDMCVFTADGCQ